jgi:Protein of unknown function (DUF3365)
MKEFLSYGERDAPGSGQINQPADVLISRPIACAYSNVHIQRSAWLHQDEFTGSNQCGNERRVHRRGIHRGVLLVVHSRGQRSPRSACRSRVDDGQRLGHPRLYGKRNSAVARTAGAGVFPPQSIPFYAATQNFMKFRERHPDYAYKEATHNLTNPRDRAADWEADIIQRFRNDATAQEVVGGRETLPAPARLPGRSEPPLPALTASAPPS